MLIEIKFTKKQAEETLAALKHYEEKVVFGEIHKDLERMMTEMPDTEELKDWAENCAGRLDAILEARYEIESELEDIA